MSSFDFTPLFQLNMMIWLSMKSPRVSGITSIFYNEGFTLKAVAPNLPIGMVASNKMLSNGINHGQSPCPEVLLVNKSKNRLVIIECKTSSFGPDSTPTDKKHQSRQCNSLLSLSGERVAELMPLHDPSKWKAYLLYVVNSPHHVKMSATLDELSIRLEDITVTPADSGAFGICERPDGIYLCATPNHALPFHSTFQHPSFEEKVMDGTTDDKARMLYLIPFDPTINKPDPYEKTMLNERIRTGLISLIGRKVVQSTFILSTEDVLKESFEIWDYWEDKQVKTAFSRQVKHYIRDVLQFLCEECDFEYSLVNTGYSCRLTSPKSADSIRKVLRNRRFREGKFDFFTRNTQTSMVTMFDDFIV